MRHLPPHQSEPLPPGTSDELRRIDAMLTLLAEREPVPGGLAARLFFASAPALPRGRGSGRRRAGAVGWLAAAASLAAASAIAFLAPTPVRPGPETRAMRFPDGVGLSAIEPLMAERELTGLAEALELWDLSGTDLMLDRAHGVALLGDGVLVPGSGM